MKPKQLRIQSPSLLSRLGAYSAFDFGLSFRASRSDRQAVRDIVTTLEDKRALYITAACEQPGHVVQSILQIRQELTAGLKLVSDKSPAKEAFRAMRSACRDFLNNPAIQNIGDEMLHHGGLWQLEEFLLGLGKLRSIFGQQIALLGYLYEIDIENHLAAVLPSAAGNDKDNEIE